MDEWMILAPLDVWHFQFISKFIATDDSDNDDVDFFLRFFVVIVGCLSVHPSTGFLQF